jgi:hypothetical protein
MKMKQVQTMEQTYSTREVLASLRRVIKILEPLEHKVDSEIDAIDTVALVKAYNILNEGDRGSRRPIHR